MPIFLQFSFIKRLARRVPKQREVVVYSEDDDEEEDWIFRGGIDASGGLSFYNWNSDRFDNNYQISTPIYFIGLIYVVHFSKRQNISHACL